ncbi:MAG TPA: hypothetical protein PK477_05525, partial [Methanoregulaceae archaeon]|nr:hypothetical protein [Methanoregulaceae archaeon]
MDTPVLTEVKTDRIFGISHWRLVLLGEFWDMVGSLIIVKKDQTLLLLIPNPVRISVTIPMSVITGTPAVVVGGGVDSVG